MKMEEVWFQKNMYIKASTTLSEALTPAYNYLLDELVTHDGLDFEIPIIIL